MVARLEFCPTQKLVMTQQLQQAIGLLELNNLNLKKFVEQELLNNPMLEFADFVEYSNIDDPYLNNNPQDNLVSGEIPDSADTNCMGSSLFANYSTPTNSEQIISPNKSLKDYVLEQMNLILMEPHLQIIGRELTDNLDEAGYLLEGTKSIADRLNIDTQIVDAVLDNLQHLDPPGIFARDLGEYLALQLREKNRLDPAMQVLVENLNLLVDFDIRLICEYCAVNLSDAIDMISELKALNPKPGVGFDLGVSSPVTPDVFVRKMPDRSLNIELNSENLPRLLINRQYYSEVKKSARRREEKVFIQSCLQSANWLIKSLNKRAETILSVASELFREQDAFLDNGLRGLRPLNLRGIAEIIGIHESTVSRVISNKYAATPHGVFELKYFFHQDYRRWKEVVGTRRKLCATI